MAKSNGDATTAHNWALAEEHFAAWAFFDSIAFDALWARVTPAPR